jgi:alpha-D-ribose 1-methylphosphonate 5-triphosphate diphosphatase
VIHDAQVAGAGITTVFDSLAIGSRSNVGLRGRELQTQCAEALTRFSERQLLRAEHFLHLRCEIATADVVEVFDSLCAHPLLQLAIGDGSHAGPAAMTRSRTMAPLL